MNVKPAFMVLAILASISFPPMRGGHSAPIDFADLERTILAELKEKNTPGAAIAIVKDDRVLYSKGFGAASVETGAPVTADMLFRLGSTTKMFTAATLVALVERGKIKLDSPVGNYVRGLSPRLSQVTAHQLISNTAGLRDTIEPLQSQDDAALGRMIRSWKDDSFFTTQGRIYSYSSAGYWLAGLVIEEVTGKPYADAMEEILFKPLGMNRSTFRPTVAMTFPLALGHNAGENKKPEVIRPAFNNTAQWPAGSIFSTASDLARFLIAFLNDGKLEGRQVLSPSLIAKLSAPYAAIPSDADSKYGYGLMNFRYRGIDFTGHGGFSRGYGSMIQMARSHRTGVVILTNRSGETLPKTLEKAMELLLPLETKAEQKPRPALSMSAAEMKDFAGAYSHPPMRWEIFAKDGKLFLRFDGAEHPLKRVDKLKFVFGASDENEIAFVRGADGNIEYLFADLYAAKKVADSR
ncbi:MAG TPA: serine hydrolase [Blastocatellia bacterium]